MLNGRIHLSVHQNFVEDCVVRKVLELLDRNNVPYELSGPEKIDIAHFIEPED